uniref:Uncharacterized protein n=1 Tax=Tanacetum cinerariifolium TaxID=118510 RepID=A0A699HEN2_TANCI|nr:hypothetical protein [Tanacetum cinerariifolium]
MAKTINGDSQIHAWVDDKEIIIIESSVRRDLRLENKEGVDCLPNSTIFENLKLMGKGSSLPTDPQHTPIILQSSSSEPQKTQTHTKPKRKNTQVPEPSGSIEHVVDEAVYKELDDRLVRAATTASSLEADQDNGNIEKTQSKVTPNEASSLGATSSGGPRGNTLQSDEDIMKLNELMKLCTNLQSKVLNLEKTKTTQALEITSLKRRVKKKQRSRTHKLKILYKVGLTARVDSSKDKQRLGEDASKQGRKINDINQDDDITLVNDQDDAKMFDVNDLHGKEVFIEKEVVDKKVNDEVQKVVEEVVEDINTTKLIVDAAQVNAAGEINAASIAITVSAAATITTEEITLAQALVEIKTTKPKAKGILLQEPSESLTTTTTIPKQKSHDKGKGIMVEEPM